MTCFLQRRAVHVVVILGVLLVLDFCFIQKTHVQLSSTADFDKLFSTLSSKTNASIQNNNKSLEQQQVLDNDGRSARFPSIEERVKLYMTNWYPPPCENDVSALVQYQVLSSSNNNSSSPWQGILLRELVSDNHDVHDTTTNSNNWNHIVQVDSEIRSDVLLLLQPANLLPQKGLPLKDYRRDALEILSPCAKSLGDVPILAQFGDMEAFRLAKSLPTNLEAPRHLALHIPHFKKFRSVLSKEEMERVTTTQVECCGADRPRPVVAVAGQSQSQQRIQPILWRAMETKRHLGPVKRVRQNDKPWNDKQSRAVFRGGLNGFRGKLQNFEGLPRNDESIKKELCLVSPRCRLVLAHAHDSLLVNARLTDMGKSGIENDNSHIAGVEVMGEPMSMQEMLDYKVLIMLEGNDVSTGLKWALRSNSVVMMPPPTYTTWVMEELLEPWVHYIPLDPSLDDVEDKMQWVLEHDEHAERIARRGSLWMTDLLEHPDAERDNIEINKRILERYQKLFVRSNRLADDG